MFPLRISAWPPGAAGRVGGAAGRHEPGGYGAEAPGLGERSAGDLPGPWVAPGLGF